MEKEHKLILLESQFYYACNSVRLLGNELRNIRSCLVLELLQIEKKKNLKLNEELEAFKHKKQDEGESKTRIREQRDEDSNTCAHMVDSGTVVDEPTILPSYLSEHSPHCRTSKCNTTATVTGNSNVLDSPTEDHVEVSKADKSYPSVLLMESGEEHGVMIEDKVEKEAKGDQLITTLQLADKYRKETTEAAVLSTGEVVTRYKGSSTQGKLMGKTLKLQIKREKIEVHEERKQERITEEQVVCKSKERVSYLQTPATVGTKMRPLLSSGPIFFHSNLRYPFMESMKPKLCAADQASSPLEASLESDPVLSDRETSPEIPMQDTSPSTSFSLPNSVNASRRTRTKKKGKVLELKTSREDKQGTKNKARSVPLNIERSSKLSDMEHTSVMDSNTKQGGNKQLRHVGKKKERLKRNKQTETTGRGEVDLNMTTPDYPSPPKKRRTLFQRTSRLKPENFELSVVNDEIYLERNSSIRMNTSNLIAPKLKKTPFM